MRAAPGGGYRGRTRWRAALLRRTRRVPRRERDLPGGALGTNSLLLRLKADPTALPKLSEQVGGRVRTNSESLICVTVPGRTDDHSKGIAINSLLQTDEHSHLEMVRYGKGSGFFRLLTAPHVRGATGFLTLLPHASVAALLHPILTLRALLVADWARRR